MFNLAWPWLLLAAPLPWLLRTLLPAAHSTGPALQVPFFTRLHRLHQQQPRHNRRPRLWLPLLIWLLLVVAASRPQWLQPQAQLNLGNSGVLLAVDLSSSMTIKDPGAEQDRYSQVRQLVARLLESRPEQPFGLILFGSKAYLQSPVTTDHASLNHWLAHSEPGMAGPDTAIGDALGLAIRKLTSTESTPGHVLLITDGASNSGVMPPRTAATLAAQQNIRIHSLGIGQPARGNPLLEPHALDEQLLQDLANQTGGRYIPAYRLPPTPALQQLLAGLPAVNQSIAGVHVISLQAPVLLAAWLLALLNGLLMLWPNLRRGKP